MNYLDAMRGMPRTKRRRLIRNTIASLKERIRYRARLATVGRRPSFTDDPGWLVDMAINRRAGWPDDPSCFRGSCQPDASGKYPKDAHGDALNHLRLLAQKINTPRVIVRYAELGEWRELIMANIPHRITMPGADF